MIGTSLWLADAAGFIRVQQRSPDKVFSGQAIPQTKPQCYTNIITVSAEWTRVDIPYGWNLKDSWGNAPLDIRINGDPKRTYPLFRGYNKEMGTDVQFKEWRVNHDYLSVTAKVVCVFTKVL